MQGSLPCSFLKRCCLFIVNMMLSSAKNPKSVVLNSEDILRAYHHILSLPKFLVTYYRGLPSVLVYQSIVCLTWYFIEASYPPLLIQNQTNHCSVWQFNCSLVYVLLMTWTTADGQKLAPNAGSNYVQEVQPQHHFLHHVIKIVKWYSVPTNLAEIAYASTRFSSNASICVFFTDPGILSLHSCSEQYVLLSL